MRVRIYVDGACSGNPGPGGWSAVFNTNKGCNILKGHQESTTNNRMELTALIKAMEKICRNGKKRNIYEIFSDSAYVVNSINNNCIDVWSNNGWKTTRGEDIKNKDLWIRYLSARKSLDEVGISLSIYKVKGHAGNTFNEYADRLARQEAAKVKGGGGSSA